MNSLSVGPIGGHLGAPRLAPAESRASDWIDSRVLAEQRRGVEFVSGAVRRKVGDAWLTLALRVHRGVVDGSRMTLELMAVGAPAEILDRSEASCAELTDVSAMAFGVASAYLEGPRSPGGLEEPQSLRVEPAGLAAGIFCEDFFGGEVALGVHQALRRTTLEPEIAPIVEAICSAARNRLELARAALLWLLGGPASGAIKTLEDVSPAQITWEGFAPFTAPESLDNVDARDPALERRGLLSLEALEELGARYLEQALPRLRSELSRKACH
ncbi:MAG: hypothetical protein KC492_27000 [Myxococcales bacterium]|nr:hypothetical protein [Myxococcales bacterium]